MIRYFSLAVLVFGSLSAVAVPRAPETFLGTIEYTGGFLQDVAAKVATPNPVKFFRVAVPQFCTGVEILEAFTTTEGIKDTATLTDAKMHLYKVNNGAGSRIGSVLLTLNGPATAKCTIPIYSTDGGTITDPGPTDAPYGNLKICNSTGVNLWVAVGYRNGNDLVSQGWWTLPSKTCRIPSTTAKSLGYIYLHAYSDNGRYWGNGPLFCVKAGGNFSTTQTACDQQQAGFSWQQFSEYTLGSAQLQVSFTP